MLVDEKAKIGNFENALVLAEGQPKLLGKVIYYQCRRGQREEAAKLLDKGLQGMEENGEICPEMVTVLVACGRYEQTVGFVRQAPQETFESLISAGPPKPSVFMAFVTAMLVLGEEQRLIDLLEDWPNELEKINGIHAVIQWKAAGNCPELEFTEEQIESWKNILLAFARQKTAYPHFDINRRMAMTRDLLRLGNNQDAKELLAETLLLVIESEHDPTHNVMILDKVEKLMNAGTMSAYLGDFNMAEKAFLSALDVCAKERVFGLSFNRMQTVRGILKAYSDALCEKEYTDIRLQTYTTRDNWEGAVFGTWGLDLFIR